MKQFIIVAAIIVMPCAASAQTLDQQLEELVAGLDNGTKLHPSPQGTAVEFYHQGLRHYFRTSEPAEVAAIQNGAAGPGWVRTMDDFPIWTTPASGRAAVCRFYAPAPNSHFYTADAAECEFVKKDPGWKYEGIAYYISGKATATTCGSIVDYSAVYRAYNNRFAQNDSNHRFTTSQSVYQQMIASGWQGEGIVMCAPTPTTVQQQRTEQLLGGTWSITYRIISQFTDRLTFSSITTSTSSNDIFAVGVSGRNTIAVGNWSANINGWSMLTRFNDNIAYPADFYVVQIVGNTMTGCYYFTLSASSIGSCYPITLGIRQ